MYDLILDYNSLLNDVMITNATYLGISVLVVLALGGISGAAVWFTSIKPYQEKISKTSESLHSLKGELNDLVKKNEVLETKINNNLINLEREYSNLNSDIESSIESLNENVRNFEQRQKELVSNTQDKLNKIEWEAEWNLHYLWDTRGVNINTLDSLIAALDKSLTIGEGWRTRMSLENIIKIMKSHGNELKELKNWLEYKKRLVEALDNVTEHKDEKLEILTLVQ